MQDHRRDQPEVPIPTKNDIQAIIAQGDPQKLVEWADKIGKAIARQVTSSQLRNIFGTARQIQMRWDTDKTAAFRDAVLLKPKLGYYAKRERGRGMADLERILSPALDEMAQGATEDERKKRYNYFVDFLEAIVAYHKKHGGN